MPDKLITAHVRYGLRNRFKCQVVDKASGEVVRETPWKSNLILDQGLDLIAAERFADLFLYCAAGTGSTAVEESSGVTTGTTAGTTLTITGGSFTFAGGDVGKLLVFSGGAQAYIDTFTGGSEVELVETISVSGETFTMYSVDQTGLVAEVARSNTYLTGAPNCETVLDGSDLEMTRTYDFSSPGGDTTYNELGWSNSASVASNLASRAIIGGGVLVTTLQQLRVVYTFIVSLSPTTPSAKTASITGWPVAPSTVTDGDEQWQCMLLSAVNTIGSSTSTGAVGFAGSTGSNAVAMEPSEPGNSTTGCYCFLSPSATAHNAFNSNGPARDTNATEKLVTQASYVPGDFYVDRSATFLVGDANRTDFRSMGIGYHSSGGSDEAYNNDNQGLVFVFDEVQAKASSHTLTLTWRISWQRVFA